MINASLDDNQDIIFMLLYDFGKDKDIINVN